MTYDTRERSVQDGAPVELYEFTRGTTVYRYTSADADRTLASNNYVAEPLRRGKIETSAERSRNSLTIVCRRNFPIADLFRVVSPTDVIAVVIKRVHRGDTDAAVIWTGRVLNCAFDGAQASLNCEPATSSLKRTGLRRGYQRQCPHVLYSQGEGLCNVNKDLHKTVTTVGAVSGVNLTVAALGSKPWRGGWVQWEPVSGSVERRFIADFSGLVLTLSQPFQGIAPGAAVTVYPGCDHTQSTCITVYANGLNYGGMPHMPDKNPFDGTPVY